MTNQNIDKTLFYKQLFNRVQSTPTRHSLPTSSFHPSKMHRTAHTYTCNVPIPKVIPHARYTYLYPTCSKHGVVHLLSRGTHYYMHRARGYRSSVCAHEIQLLNKDRNSRASSRGPRLHDEFPGKSFKRGHRPTRRFFSPPAIHTFSS